MHTAEIKRHLEEVPPCAAPYPLSLSRYVQPPSNLSAEDTEG